MGTNEWKAVGEPGTGVVQVGVQLLDGTGRVMIRHFGRAHLRSRVRSGESAVVLINIGAPQPGMYQLKFDLVAEGITWFEQKGSKPHVRDLTAFTPE